MDMRVGSDNSPQRLRIGFQSSLWTAILIVAFLIWLIYIQKPDPNVETPAWVLLLPTWNAVCNALSAVFLLRGVLQVKRGLKEEHKKSIFIALAFSALFLAGYVTFYWLHGDRRFLGTGLIRPFYFFVLVSHILISIISLPAILYTLALGLQKSWINHRKWARWTFPMWLYVNVTGVLIHILFSLFSKAASV